MVQILKDQKFHLPSLTLERDNLEMAQGYISTCSTVNEGCQIKSVVPKYTKIIIGLNIVSLQNLALRY